MEASHLTQVNEVAASTSSLCKGACFVLDDDAGRTLYLLYCPGAGIKLKSKALDAANSLRGHRGTMRVRACSCTVLLWVPLPDHGRARSA